MESNIKGHPDYHITKSGIVYSNKRGRWVIRKTSLSNTNRVRVRIDGKWEQVSRLVALAYIPNPNHLPVVMHLDNNPLNNSVENLKWGTQSDNIQQAYNEKRITPNHLMVNGEKHPGTKITNQLRYILVDLYLNYQVPIPKLSIIFGVSKRHITKVIHQYKSGIRWF